MHAFSSACGLTRPPTVMYLMGLPPSLGAGPFLPAPHFW